MGTYEKLIGELGTVDFNAGKSSEVKALADEAMNRAQVMAHTATERVKLERQQAEIRQSLGPLPDVDEAQKEFDAANQRLLELNAELKIAAQAWNDAGAKLKGRRMEVEQHRQRAEILKRPVQGPTLEEAESARVEAETLAGRAMRAQVLGQAEAYTAEHTNADRVKHDADTRGKALREIARGTSDALGRLLERRGLPGLSIVEGRLCVKDGDTVKDFDKRLSFGQRVRVALGIALAGIDVSAPEHRTTGNKLPVLPLEPGFWTALDPVKQAEVAQIAKERGVCLITEAPGEGALRFDRMV